MLRKAPLRRAAIRRRAPRRVVRGDPAYLEWIRGLPCLLCFRSGQRQNTRTDAHHYGPRGLSQKAPDRQAIPLCHFEHHEFGPESVHVLGRHWAARHEFDAWAEIARLNALYDFLQTMTPSDRCIELIRSFEGFSASPYLCPAGIATIGYGHTEGVTLTSQSITEARALELLKQDITRFAAGVAKLLQRAPTQGQFDALVSLAFNIGLGNLRASTLLRKFNRGDIAGTADQFGVWNQANGRVLPGLVRRRAAERDLFLA